MRSLGILPVLAHLKEAAKELGRAVHGIAPGGEFYLQDGAQYRADGLKCGFGGGMLAQLFVFHLVNEDLHSPLLITRA